MPVNLCLGLLFAIAGAGTPLFCHAHPLTPGYIVPVAVIDLTALPDATMAVVTGAGFQGPNVTGSSTPQAPIILWDELHAATQKSPINLGTSTITLNGKAQ